MSSPIQNKKERPIAVQRQYRDNFARHVLGLTLYIESSIMEGLKASGHDKLRLNFGPYISFITNGGTRLSEIAQALGVTRQAANQTANQLVDAGYIQRVDDPGDSRAKLLMPTQKLQDLVSQGLEESSQLQTKLTAFVCEKELEMAGKNIQHLSASLETFSGVHREDLSRHLLAIVLPQLSNYITERLQLLTMAKGHPRLKRSFGAVLTAIGPQGGQIKNIAEAYGISKQAVSTIATDLESLGYIQRQPDRRDPRKLLLTFTNLGKKLIEDSVASVDELDSELSKLIGGAQFAQIKSVLKALYSGLKLEADVFEYIDDDILALADELKQKLGKARISMLVKALLAENNI